MRRQEWIRKSLHVPGGLVPPLVVAVFGWTGSVAIAFFLLAYLLVAWDLDRRRVRLPIVWALVEATRREHEPEPVAATEFLVSVIVLGLLFPLPYFYGAVALLGVGDGLASLAGQLWGRRRLPWNATKTWMGLGAGVVAGTIAYVGFALIGAYQEIDGYATTSPILGPNGTWPVLPVLVGAFAAVHAVAWAVARKVGHRHANASFAQVTLALGVALVPALAVLLVLPLALHGPVLPLWGGHGSRALLTLVPGLVMVVESFLRRHDNLWVPMLGAGLAYLVAGVASGGL